MRKPEKSGAVTAAFDRGRAKYFHGRKQILRDFNELVERAEEADGGATFLIQGAPGAGKTALLYECEQRAEKRGWEAVDISSAALWEPNELQRALESKRKFDLDGGSAGVSFLGVVNAKIAGRMRPPTVKSLLQEGDAPLLLKLDEAQILGKKDMIPAGKWHTAVDVLQSIHNGNLQRPVILIAAGLGSTTQAFRALGISRFAESARVELGALGKDTERTVLRDWLTEEGKATGDTTAWIDAISQESHGWPQHILAYVKPALNQLAANKGAMTAEGLATVLEAGRARRTTYYEGRMEDFDEEHLQIFAKALVDVPPGGSTTRSAILAPLTEEYGAEEAKNLFRGALYCGMLHKQAGRYAVPIPSMHGWLVSNYGRIQVKGGSDRPLGQIRDMGGRDLGW